MNAFLTGSYVYGKPRPNSDIDLVIQVDHFTATLLRKLSDDQTYKGNNPNAVRFGRLNLILCESDDDWACWKVGTSKITKSGEKLDKIRAKRVFDEIREQLGLRDQGASESCSVLTVKQQE